MKAKREDKGEADKRERDDEKDVQVKAARNQQGMTDVSSPGASSSNKAAGPSAQPQV